jgi:hypothetical protein
VVLCLYWALRAGPATIPAADVLAPLLPVLVLQGLITFYVGTALWYGALERLDLARTTAIVVPSIPILSLGASFLLLGEVASPSEWAGSLAVRGRRASLRHGAAPAPCSSRPLRARADLGRRPLHLARGSGDGIATRAGLRKASVSSA